MALADVLAELQQERSLMQDDNILFMYKSTFDGIASDLTDLGEDDLAAQASNIVNFGNQDSVAFTHYGEIDTFVQAVSDAADADDGSPTVVSFDPVCAAVGDTVVITGTHFDTATDVSFYGVDADSFNIDSSTQITAVLGAGDYTADTDLQGAVLVVNTINTQWTFGFQFSPVPTITSTDPDISNQMDVGNPLGIIGTGFIQEGGFTTATVGGSSIAADDVTVDDSDGTTITLTIPDDAVDGDITVTTPGGTATLAGFHIDSGGGGEAAFINGAGNGNNSSTPHSITVDVPDDVVDTQLMFAIIGYGGAEAACDGWTALDMGGAFNATILTRIADSEPANYTFTGTVGFMMGIIGAYSDLSSVDDFSHTINSPPSPIATESVTAVGAGLYIVALMGQRDSSLPHFLAAGGGLTLDYLFDFVGLTTSMAFFSKPITEAGDTGVEHFSNAVSDSNGVVIFSMAVS